MEKGENNEGEKRSKKGEKGVEKEAIESGKEEATVDLITKEKVLNFDLRYEG